MADLSGKNILITGASRGIGAAAARLSVEKGARLIAHASQRSDAADAIDEIAKASGGALLTEDLAEPGAGARLIDGAIDVAGSLDVVVNNAGVYLPTPVSGTDADWDLGWAATLSINVKAPADICRAAVTHFREKGGGRIINIASRAAYRGDGLDHAGYAASKAALNALTKTLARGLSGENILVYAIAPGWVETRMAPQDIANRAAAVKDIPLGRVAHPDEVASMIAFLASDGCPSATGSTFDINGASYVR